MPRRIRGVWRMRVKPFEEYKAGFKVYNLDNNYENKTHYLVLHGGLKEEIKTELAKKLRSLIATGEECFLDCACLGQYNRGGGYFLTIIDVLDLSVGYLLCPYLDLTRFKPVRFRKRLPEEELIDSEAVEEFMDKEKRNSNS